MKKTPNQPLSKTAAIEELETKFKGITRKESHAKLDQAGQQFAREWLLIRYDMQDATKAEKEKLFAWGERLMESWDTDEPALVHSQKIINRLAGSATGEAAKYAEQLDIHRNSEKSERQRGNATGERDDPLKDLLRGFISAKNDISRNETIEKLRQLVGAGVITEVTEDEIYYLPDPNSDKEKNLKISSIGPKISGLRKKRK